jgi:hypothetical protein
VNGAAATAAIDATIARLPTASIISAPVLFSIRTVRWVAAAPGELPGAGGMVSVT